MTEVNIFKDHERFEQRGNPGVEVDYHWWESIGRATYVADDGSFTYVKSDGSHSLNNVPGTYDLVPMLPPPVMVPWDCPDDVPDNIWIRERDKPTEIFNLVGFFQDGAYLGNADEYAFTQMFVNCEWHTNRKAKDGWQVCGKLKDAQK